MTKPEHEVTLAFVHEGKEYFMFVNEQNLPSERAFSAIDIYEEMNQRMTREYLEVMLESVLNLVNKGDLVKISSIILFAQQRLEHITNIDILYKLASVLYFTKDENCYKYDREFNEKKIASWKASPDIDGFFLKTPIQSFLPSFDGSSLNTQSFTKVQNSEMISNMKFLSSILSGSEKNSDILTKLKSQIESLTKWNASLE